MSNSYTVRLEDGSEIGPLDLSAVREWYARGLIHGDSPVLAPGSQRWRPLRQVADVRPPSAPPAGRPPRPAGRAPARPAPPMRGRAAAPSARRGGAWGLLACVGVVALAGGVYWQRTGRVTPAPAVEASTAATADPLSAAARLTLERRAEAVGRAVAQAPHLTPRSAEALMRRSQAEVLAPEETYRRAEIALRRGLPALSASETRELGRLTDARRARVSARERMRLATYLEHLRVGRPTSPQDDLDMARLVQQAEARLPPASLQRLRVLYEKAVLAAAEAR